MERLERLEQRMQRHAGNGCQPGSSAPDPAIAPSPSASPFATRGPVPGLVNWPHIDRDVAFAGASVASRKLGISAPHRTALATRQHWEKY